MKSYWYFFRSQSWLLVLSNVLAFWVLNFGQDPSVMMLLLPFLAFRGSVYIVSFVIFRYNASLAFFYQNLGISVLKLGLIVYGIDFLVSTTVFLAVL